MCGPHRSDLEQNGTLGFGALSPQVLPPQSDRFRRACYRVAGDEPLLSGAVISSSQRTVRLKR